MENSNEKNPSNEANDFDDLLISSGHDYDGIKEYDNPLPRWWVYMFYITIVVSFWYCGYYFAKASQLSDVDAADAQVAWSASKLQLEQKQARAQLKQQAPASAQKDLAFYMSDEASIKSGASLYATNCVACHGNEGQGLVGPNLVDKFWIHGANPEDIQKAISQGFPAKGMVPWEPVLGKQKVIELTAYVMSIRGNTVANPKAPQGDEVP